MPPTLTLAPPARPGVCLVTSGPGITNAVTGIATAYMDSIPLVVISGQVPKHAIGQDAFQEADALGITRSCTKYNALVQTGGRYRARYPSGLSMSPPAAGRVRWWWIFPKTSRRKRRNFPIPKGR